MVHLFKTATGLQLQNLNNSFFLSQVNTRGEECLLKLDDPKWNDVNVVTSLLKSFFRKLPDPIFTTEMYNIFIDASKIEETHKRLNALRKLFYELPEVNYETLLHLVSHLRLGFCEKKILSILSYFLLREKLWHSKKLSNFEKLQFSMIFFVTDLTHS